MIKKIIKINFVLLILILFMPLTGNAQTLNGLRNELTELQNKKTEQDKKKAQTESEISKNKSNIVSANNEISKAEKEISNLNEQIASNTESIKKLKEETEGLLIEYQKLQNENVYADYIEGATSITNLIMRMNAINQITEYNEEKIVELELLTKNNEKMNKELENYQSELNNKITNYENLIDSLGDDLSEIVEGAETIESEIKSKKELIKYYESAGCKDNDDLATCVSIANNSGFLRPLIKGRITSNFGWRVHPTKGVYKFHNGIDIAIAEGTKVYAPANGVVGKITRKSSCGGNMIYLWCYVNGVKYTFVFMHLLEVKVNVGDKVTTDTVIGLVGGGSTATSRGGYDSCTTGAHLHYGVSKGNFYLQTSKDTYSKFTSGMINPPGFPSLGSWFYTR